jgi:plastocyanin
LPLIAALMAAFGVAHAGAATTPEPKESVVLDDYFAPHRLSLPRGGSVRWVWSARNLHPHNVRLVDGPPGVSKKRYRSQTSVRQFDFERAFPKPGTYQFFCTLHPFTMRQTVAVRR